MNQSAHPSSQGLKAAALTPSAKCCRPEGPKQWVKGWVGGFGEMGRGSDWSAHPEPEYQLTHAASTLMGPAFEKPSHLGGSAEQGGSGAGGPQARPARGSAGDSCRGQGRGHTVGSPGQPWALHPLPLQREVSCPPASQGDGNSSSVGFQGACGFQGGLSQQRTADSTLVWMHQEQRA